MALKRTVTKAEFDKLVKQIQTEYKADESGENYVLEVDGLEDTTALKAAKDHEKNARKAAEKKVTELEATTATLTEERDNLLKGTIPKANVEALENSYKQKLATKETELNGKIAAQSKTITKVLVDNVAQSLATKISVSPSLLIPHIRARLTVEEANGEFTTRVLDAKGAPSASTIEDLEKEFLANKEFAPVLIGSKGSGSAGTGAKDGSAGRSTKADGKIDFGGKPSQVANALRDSGKLVMPPG